MESNLSTMDGIDQLLVNIEDKTVALELNEDAMPQVAERVTELTYSRWNNSGCPMIDWGNPSPIKNGTNLLRYVPL